MEGETLSPRASQPVAIRLANNDQEERTGSFSSWQTRQSGKYPSKCRMVRGFVLTYCHCVAVPIFVFIVAPEIERPSRSFTFRRGIHGRAAERTTRLYPLVQNNSRSS